MSKSIFFVGITGYIGGSVVSHILTKHKSEFTIRALVRKPEDAEKIRALGANVQPVLGSLEDAELLASEAAAADVTINTAHADHLAGAQAILTGLKRKGHGAKYIHTSGTGVLIENAEGRHLSPEIYSDADLSTYYALPDSALHKDVDNVVVHANGPDLRTVVVCPPTIYGRGSGVVSIQSQQVPMLLSAFIKNRQARTINQGLNAWCYVHVEDLAEFYVLLLEKLVAGQLPDKDNYYYCAVFELTHAEMARIAADRLFERRLIDSPEVKPVDGDVAAFFGNPYAPLFLASNSRCNAERARQMGWKPTHPHVRDTIDFDIDLIVRR